MTTDYNLEEFSKILNSDRWTALSFDGGRIVDPEIGEFKTVFIADDHESDDFYVIKSIVTELPDGRLFQWVAHHEKVDHIGGRLDFVDVNRGIREVEKKTRIITETYFEDK